MTTRILTNYIRNISINEIKYHDMDCIIIDHNIFYSMGFVPLEEVTVINHNTNEQFITTIMPSDFNCKGLCSVGGSRSTHSCQEGDTIDILSYREYTQDEIYPLKEGQTLVMPETFLVNFTGDSGDNTIYTKTRIYE